MNGNHNGLYSRAAEIKGIVFDFDGTLASLVIDFGLMKKRVAAMAETFGIDASVFDGRYLLEGVDEAKTLLSESGSGNADEFEGRAKEIIESMEIEAAAHSGLFPDARPSLAALRDAGISLAIITRNFGGAVDAVFPDMLDFCPVFIPREKTPKVKPDPVHLQTALDLLQLAPKQVLMVGDHPIDIHTGQAVGALTVGVASGRISREDLAAAGADFVYGGVGEMTDRLLGRALYRAKP